MRPLLSILLLTLASLPALAGGKVESLGACTDTGVPEAVRQALEARGYRVTLDDGVTIDLWFRSQVPVAKSPDAAATAGADFSFERTTLIGVALYAKPAKDFRNQNIRPGAYTLRYELHPADGNHMGVAPARDFLLMVPAASDPGPDASLNYDQLIALSKKATGTNHPAPLDLAAPEAQSFPAVYENSEGHTLVAVKLKTASGDVPIALVLKGVSAVR